MQLLEALRKWTRAEADAVRFAKAPDEITATIYAARLERWGQGVCSDTSPTRDSHIPYLTSTLRTLARDVSDDIEERLILAVALYRRDYNKFVSPFGGGICFEEELESRMASTGECRRDASFALMDEYCLKRDAKRDAEIEAKFQ